MAKQKGRLFLLNISDGAGGFTTFGGVTSKTMSINNEPIDATTPNPANPEGPMWRCLLDATKQVDVSGDVTLVGDGSMARAVEIAMADTPKEIFQVIVPEIGTFEGTFFTNLEFGDDGKVTASLSLQSDGEVTFTPYVAPGP